MVTLIDVTKLAEAEEHQQVLISELNHRVKNMLTVVISIANHTLVKAPTPEAFAEALIGRLQAMARGYNLLSVTNWKEAQIGELVQREVEHFDAERFAISGPEIKLTPQQALSMTMVIHELATNAAKYGALSKPGGRVVMAWDKKDGRFEMDWKEIDGPPVEQAKHEGFGLFLIRGEIKYRMAGEVAVDFAPDGLDVKMAFPLREGRTP